MKKTLKVMTGTVLVAGLLSACSGNNAGTGSGNTPDPVTTAEGGSTGGAKQTVEFWHSLGGKNGEYIDTLVGNFNAAQDEIEVVATQQGGYAETVTKLQQAIASGSAPDLAMIERAYVEMFADAEVLADLTPFLEGSGMSQDDFTEGLMGHSVFHDQLVSLPLNRSTPILHVNKSILDEAGLSVPTNWQELKETANALVVEENGEYERYGVTMPYDTWYPIAMISQAGGTFFNEDKSSVGFVDNGAGEKVFSFLKELQSTGALFYPPAQDSGNIVNQMFVSGKVGMMYQSTGSIGGLMESVDFDYVTAFLPQDEQYANPTGGANISLLEGSDNKEAAWEFVRWIMTEDDGALDFILKSGYLPFTNAMVESEQMQQLWQEEPNRKVAYEQLQYATDTNMHVAWPEVMHEFFSAIEAIMYDSQDIPATLATFTRETERILTQ
ncbi:ABC transporter substrate-binding protein [Paenibacillus sp. 1P07SE]|uniref:ABC transporter substrate-binding protein n=1 Tax=Paenibacillus sp. 1P07SE TaxID=3132209 RepID=UPI0039A5431C